MGDMLQDAITVGVLLAIGVTYYCQYKRISIKELLKAIAEWYRNYGEEEYEEVKF